MRARTAVAAALVILTFVCGTGMARSEIREIVDAAALRVLLDREGVIGDTLVLAPGDYPAIGFRPGTAPRAIHSADPDEPARLAGLIVNGAEGFTLEDIVLDYRFADGDDQRTRPFIFRNSSDVVIRDVRVLGDVARGLGPAADGFGIGIGLTVRGCRRVLLEGSHISGFHRAMTVRESRNVTIRGNEVTSVRSDGMNFSQVADVIIEDNLIHSFDRSPDAGDHADMIQFWTNGTDAPSVDITIRGNLLMSGEGLWTQSIFMRNELVDTGQAGPEMYYRNLLIEENVIINAHSHGISVGETRGLMIRRNTLVQNPLSAGDSEPRRALWIPRVRVSMRSENVRIFENLVLAIDGFEGQSDWELRGNVTVQNQSLLRPAHYNQVFAGWPGGDPRDPYSFRYRPDGLLAGLEVGAALLRDPDVRIRRFLD